MLTQSLQFAVLVFDPASNGVRTEATGSALSSYGSVRKSGALVAVFDGFLAFHAFHGILRIVPFESRGGSGKFTPQDAFDVRLTELDIVDLAVVQGEQEIELVVLFSDAKKCRKIRWYVLDLEEKELRRKDVPQLEMERSCKKILPVKDAPGSVLVAGDHSVAFCHPENTLLTPKSFGVVVAVSQMQKGKFLLGQLDGSIRLLEIPEKKDGSQQLTLHRLGTCSIPSTLEYLDNGVVFIGSAHGDSHLIRLTGTLSESGNYFQIIQTYANIGPVLDMELVQDPYSGYKQLITCSGFAQEGSLRILSTGISAEDLSEVEIEGIKGLWAMNVGQRSSADRYLVLSFSTETRVLMLGALDSHEDKVIELAEVEQPENPGFLLEDLTLAAGSTENNSFFQITPSVVRLISATDLTLLDKWSLLSVTISAGHTLRSHVAVVLNGNAIQILKSTPDNSIIPLGDPIRFESEIACLRLCEIHNTTEVESMDVDESHLILAVGLWDLSVHLIDATGDNPSTWKVGLVENLSEDHLPRSLLISSLDGIARLFVGTGDGVLYSYSVRKNKERKTFETNCKSVITLGRQPLSLIELEINGLTSIFAKSDLCTLISSINGRLHYKNIDKDAVAAVCLFSYSDALSDCIALATSTSLSIASLSSNQRVKIRKVSLSDQPRRIVYHSDSKSLVVGCISCSEEYGVLHLLDERSFESLDSFSMEHTEVLLSLAIMPFGGDDFKREFIVVGTAFVVEEESEPLSGRLLLFEVSGPERLLSLLHSSTINGGAYSLARAENFPALLVAVNNQTHIYELEAIDASFMDHDETGYSTPVKRRSSLKSVGTNGSHSFSLVCKGIVPNYILSIYLKSRGSLVLLGDMMRSLTLYSLKGDLSGMSEIAKDYNPRWPTAIEFIDDNTFIGCDQYSNLFVLNRDLTSESESKRACLQAGGFFHLGEMVNVIRHGSLDTHSSAEYIGHVSSDEGELSFADVKGELLLGSTGGSISIISPLSEAQFMFLIKLEKVLEKHVFGYGNFSHETWRSVSNSFDRFKSPQALTPATNFIDGDFIAAIAHMDEERLSIVCKELELPIETLKRFIKDLQLS